MKSLHLLQLQKQRSTTNRIDHARENTMSTSGRNAEEDRNYDGIAISTDERACMLIRTLRPAIRGGTGLSLCSHARGSIRESKSVPTRISYSERKMTSL